MEANLNIIYRNNIFKHHVKSLDENESLPK